MPVLNAGDWIILGLIAFSVINLIMVSRAYSRLRHQKVKVYSQKRRIHDLEEDVRALYEASTTLGSKLHSLEHSSRVLKEQQEQLTLKEPNQQTYRNAIQAIHNGNSVNQVAESSGLSRGEVELLTLLQKINSNTSEKDSSQTS